ncbi:MAG: tRNA (guanine26-N2/guanine27-N2)-dimethyltransferase [Candidatus Nanohaloarchaea archaeon]|jgi:tRNA (guanine26-N2/guanine27-N2)-dimethyltransferase
MVEERGFEIEAETGETKDAEVFYNPAMNINRDVSEAAVKQLAEILDDFRVCDVMAASGIRALRYAEYSDELHINDANPQAVETINNNIEKYEIEAAVSREDANVFLSGKKNFFNFIDIDPFGTFLPYIDSAARAANHESAVAVTGTDNAAPAGSYPKVCQRLYGSKPLKNSFMHETGLRIYIKEVFRAFARYDKAFEPVLSFHERHYSRTIGRVTESKKRTNRNLDNIGYLSYCSECGWRTLERIEECENCGEDTQIAGPLWTGRLSDKRFTENVLEDIPEEWEEAREIVEKVDSEAEINVPYYDTHNLCSIIGVSAPSLDSVIQEIRDRGYPISRTHFSPTGFRTSMPIDQIHKVLKSKA